MPVLRVCQHCQKTFSVFPAQLRKGHGSYCSQNCAARYVQGTLEERFWRRVSLCEHAHPCPACCWLWQGTKDSKGYGRIRMVRRRRMAHHISWELFHHTPFVPDYPRLIMRHLCHVPACVNPLHLTTGNQTDNMHDSTLAGRLRSGEEHPQAKLTAHAVQDMRRLRSQGMSYAAIAPLFGVHQFVARAACQGDTWKHVD